MLLRLCAVPAFFAHLCRISILIWHPFCHARIPSQYQMQLVALDSWGHHRMWPIISFWQFFLAVPLASTTLLSNLSYLYFRWLGNLQSWTWLYTCSTQAGMLCHSNWDHNNWLYHAITLGSLHCSLCASAQTKLLVCVGQNNSRVAEVDPKPPVIAWDSIAKCQDTSLDPINQVNWAIDSINGLLPTLVCWRGLHPMGF